MATSLQVSWQRLRAIDIAQAVVLGHSTVRTQNSVRVRPLSLPKIGRGFLVTLIMKDNGCDAWPIFVESSALEDTRVRAWLYVERHSPTTSDVDRSLESRDCRLNPIRGWSAPDSTFMGEILPGEPFARLFGAPGTV